MPTAVERAITAGCEALDRAAWAEARAHFEGALAAGESIEALEGFGTAARWQMDGPPALAAHERAYRLARENGDDSAAARIALELTFDALQFRGEAETRGWLERAGRLLDGLPPVPEHALHAYLRANRALNVDHDPPAALQLVSGGVDAARAAGAFDYEMVCVALEGLTLVAGGEVDEGMRRLDEATTAAVAGEVASLRIAETICCHLIDACQRVRDIERAGEWCRRVEEMSARHADTEMFCTCRIHYADVLVWQGSWNEADEMLTAACRDLGGIPRKVVEGLVRLAELRRRQGRVDQAEALLAQAEPHRAVLLVRAALALDRGAPGESAELAQRFLRRVSADRLERVPALELLVRAQLALDNRGGADAAAAELDEIADDIGTAPLRAAALLARGRIEGRAEPLEDAADLFAECGARYDCANTQLELARALRAQGRSTDAERAESAARDTLATLGVPAPAAERSLLTRREREVVRLLAAGRSNDEIAQKLVLSVRTVERHVENIYDKIGVSGRSARAAATAWALAHGLA
jgi:DNA-binding CsgD family transcriptional regulator/tetratricopeptide (TPR) repeat protein